MNNILWMVEEPTYGWRGMEDNVPSLSEVFREWWDSVAFHVNRRRIYIAAYTSFLLITFASFVGFILSSNSSGRVLFFICSVLLLANVYNTVWYHRYCSHRAFQFSNRWAARIFLWTNPLFFKEEHYAIPHLLHHEYVEKQGDPYGPHLGWWGSFFGTESGAKINTEISEELFLKMKNLMAHVYDCFNSYQGFKRSSSIENEWVSYLRVFVSNIIWVTVIVMFFGKEFIPVWYGAIFFMLFLIKSFNYYGHGGANYSKPKKKNWEFDDNSFARNQYFYGYLAGEWHDNHHICPNSSNNGFLRSQLDVPFIIIKFLYKIRVVKSYIDLKPLFLERNKLT